jgi:hypothetical protein
MLARRSSVERAESPTSGRVTVVIRTKPRLILDAHSSAPRWGSGRRWRPVPAPAWLAGGGPHEYADRGAAQAISGTDRAVRPAVYE